MEYLFYIVAVLCCYSYFLYPLILMLLPVRQSGILPSAREEDLPGLSLIITAHNEEAMIRDKLENALSVEYPPGLLEIIVASDCSSDSTDDIVRSYHDRGIILVRADERRGKEYAQFCAIGKASGDVLVFSDVATRFPPDAFRKLAFQFRDRTVGAVSSEDRFISNDGQIVGEGMYVRYEMWLRKLESVHAGLVGLSGSFFAARREICADWDIHSPSDFNTALNTSKLGMYAVSCPEVTGIYTDIKDPAAEYRRKVRTVIRGITAVTRHPEVLNPLRMGLFAFQIWSHKIMRWAVPWFMAVFALLTIMLLDRGGVYIAAFAIQVVFYGSALAAWLSAAVRKHPAPRIIFFFVQTNLALAQAALMFLGGTRMTVWTPSRR